jgi:Nuclease-related domain
MNWNTMLLPSAYLAFFALSALAILWWERRKRGTRVPFAKDLRLLRVAGEHQLKLINRLDEGFLLMMLGAALAPCLVALVLLEGVVRLRGWWLVAGAAAVVLASLAAFLLALRWFVARLRERGNRYLGYVGERVVAEYLEPLRAGGWLVFHDVPCESGREKFNIDHVAVGPGGVFAIETKARRKGAARAGREDYKVFFDGEQLSWPWGEDQHGLDQAVRNAQWLQQWLRKTTGEKLEVVPVLALPGWYVEAPARAAVRVVNPAWLPDLLAGDGATVLGGKQVELCARQLEQRCRDVEF